MIIRRRSIASLFGLSFLFLLRTPSASSKDREQLPRYYKVVQYFATAESFNPFLDACRENADASSKEHGILGFSFFAAPATPFSLTVIETYKDQLSSKEHMNTEHFKKFIENLKRLQIKRTVIEGSDFHLIDDKSTN
ncbi:antibiotic biosynthesis monooxygenase [Acetobacter sacchari]|uniref:Antibiotic biosynthesis monooxygenase n=1 Tax=Acetobacter sacchari TaxID=2661687 RepID=A0ABS3M0E1_9PROT|nr:antibiotic biosynthesis monooxygenase [Acetobacter sacchari]MBO1361629.1 antibiotic biosynthesis monooxygenase [Acetobacter sacchari]